MKCCHNCDIVLLAVAAVTAASGSEDTRMYLNVRQRIC